MRIDTKQKLKLNRVIYIICIFFIGINLLFALLQNDTTGDIYFGVGAIQVHINGIWVDWYTPIYWPFILVLLFLILRGPIRFQYDTDGDVMNLKVTDSFLFFLGNFANKHYEFPKRKLISWDILTLPFFKLLTINIESKTGSIRTRKMLVSYLSERELQKLKRSLNKSQKLNIRFSQSGDSLRKPKSENEI
jgi:hypothetical protein